MDRFEPIQPVHAERNDRGGGRDAIMDQLKMLTVAEVDQDIGRTVRSQRDGGVDLRQGLDRRQRGWRVPKDDDAGVVLRQPEDRGVRWSLQRVDREIATPIGRGFSGSTLSDRHRLG